MVADRENTVWIGLEYFVDEGDRLWNMADEDLIQLGIKEAAQIGFIDPADFLDGCAIRMPKAYPLILELTTKSGVAGIRDAV